MVVLSMRMRPPWAATVFATTSTSSRPKVHSKPIVFVPGSSSRRAGSYPAGTDVLPTEAGWHHLVYAWAGVMTAETDGGTWVIPPHRALWAPDGVAVRIVRHGRVSVRSLYFHRSLVVLPATVQVLD